jgi:hypothetical protein
MSAFEATVCLAFAGIARRFFPLRKIVGAVTELAFVIGLSDLSIIFRDLVLVWKASFHEKNLVDWLSQVERTAAHTYQREGERDIKVDSCTVAQERQLKWRGISTSVYVAPASARLSS